jgi:putative nucleotidyltransferase with HDIG domain
MMNTIKALACAVDAKDHYTHDHSDRVSRLCVESARCLGITNAETLRKTELAGLLHDVGKIGIPDAILCKPSHLTADEFTTIKTHVEIGARIVRKVSGLEEVAMAILHHHERYDGLGYPGGLSGDEIPLGSKLIAVSDAYDTLTSDRSYRKASPVEEALQELRMCKGNQFDPQVVDAVTEVVNRGFDTPEETPDEAQQIAEVTS